MSYTKVVLKKKKSQQNPRVTTHNRGKEDYGGPPRSAGRKSKRWNREKECIRNIADGSQKMILDSLFNSLGKK